MCAGLGGRWSGRESVRRWPKVRWRAEMDWRQANASGAEVIHSADFAEDLCEGSYACLGQADFQLFTVQPRQLQCAADLLLTLQQGCVFLAQWRPILLSEETQPISSCSRIAFNDSVGAVNSDAATLARQTDTPARRSSHRQFCCCKCASSPPGLALFNQWQRNAKASVGRLRQGIKANNRLPRCSPAC